MRAGHDRCAAEERSGASGIPAPQDRDERPATRDEPADRDVRDCLPPAAAMRARRTRRHGQHTVEEQHALSLPPGEITVWRNRHTEIVE